MRNKYDLRSLVSEWSELNENIRQLSDSMGYPDTRSMRKLHRMITRKKGVHRLMLAEHRRMEYADRCFPSFH